jgi:cell wall-associated NlpC family hydrolase
MNLSDLVGLPYRDHGRDESGLDCFGLIWLIAMRNGTPIPDPWYEKPDPSLVKLADQMNVERCEFRPGCIIEMVRKNRLHLGYALDGDKMIHCTSNEGVVVENIDRDHAKGYYQFKQILFNACNNLT